MRLRNARIWVQLLLTVALALAVVWAAVIAWDARSAREAAVEQATVFSKSMHEATMAGLTAMMVTGTVNQRAVFLDQVRQLDAIRDLRVLRGAAVTRLFCPGQGAEQAVPDAVEREVLATGRAVVQVQADAKGDVLRVVRPALAQADYLGKNCLACHRVDAGTVLGVVSMKVSLETADAAAAAMRWKSVVAALVTCGPVLLLIYPFIQRVVTRPLEKGVALAHGIARGDLAQTIAVETTNETGRLHAALHDMRDSLAGTVARVRAGSHAVATTTAQLAAGNADLSTRTGAQVQAVQDAASRTAALAAAARRNAGGARQADALARSAADVAARGGSAVQRMVGSMDSIHDTSRRIAEITGLIDSLAFRTNLLALNAAVEAARAGEQGRGFAVVAGEVRQLATQSAGAAREIKALVDTAVGAIDGGTRLANEAGGTMQEVVASVARVNTLIGEIASASAEQIEGVEQVDRAIAQIDEVARRNAALVKQAAQATQALEAQAGELQHAVGVFRLSAPG